MIKYCNPCTEYDNYLTACLLHYVARTRQHWNGHDTRIRDKFFKIHTIRLSDTFRTRHGFMIRMSVLHSFYILTTHTPEWMNNEGLWPIWSAKVDQYCTYQMSKDKALLWGIHHALKNKWLSLSVQPSGKKDESPSLSMVSLAKNLAPNLGYWLTASYKILSSF